MKWCLPFEPNEFSDKIRIGDSCILMGSCFAQNILKLGQRHGMNFQSPQIGTIFHPLALQRILTDAMNENWDAFASRCFQSDTKEFKSWDLSNQIAEPSLEKMKDRAIQIANNLQSQLQSCKVLILTFGSAFGYDLNGLVVSNCHKQSPSLFLKQLSELEQLKKAYTELLGQLKRHNPNIKVFVTVSPVRHKRDGLVENNRSKARLLMLSEYLESIGCYYFPAYEIVMDQLRDHRFYEADLVHPNDTAVETVWDQFASACLADNEKELRTQIMQVNRMLEHRINDPSAFEEWNEKVQKKKADLTLKNPGIYWA